MRFYGGETERAGQVGGLARCDWGTGAFSQNQHAITHSTHYISYIEYVMWLME